MSLLHRTVNVLRKSADEVTWPTSWNEWFGGGVTDAGVSVNSETAMRLSAVYGSRRLIAYTIAGLPAHALFKKPVGNGRYSRILLDPQPPWLLRPNAEQTWPEFCAQMVDSALSDGNFFVDLGVPNNLFVLNPSGVVVGREQATKKLFYATTQGRVINPSSIVHGRALTLAGHDRGLSPIEMARQEIGLGQAAQKYLAKFYVNGATVSAVLEFPAGMSEEMVKDSVRVFKETYGGSDKAHSVAGLSAATYKPMSVTNEQAQFLESRQFTVVDIGTRIFGIPPHRLGAMLDKPQFGNSIEQQNMSFVQDAIMPWTTLIEAVLTRWVLKGRGYFHFSLNGLLRGDAASRAAYYQTMRQQLGVFNGDDILELEDMNPMPDGKGEAYWMPANTYLVGPDGFPILPERQPAPDSSP